MVLDYVTFGRFSGSATSLAAALEDRIDLQRRDLTTIARHPRLFHARTLALLEARKDGADIPWSKTAAWSEGLQHEAIRRRWLTPSRSSLFVQSMAAFQPPVPSGHYFIYTDRLAAENDHNPSRFAPRASRAWLERERGFVRGAAGTFVMGESSATSAVESYGVDRHRVHVLGAGPNTPPAATNRSSDECRTLLFVGTQWELKGGPELLRAFATVSQDRPDLQLVIAGSEAAGGPSNVEVVGRVTHEEMTDLYARADALVIPTHVEAYGIALTEAILSGVPCIGTTVGNQPTIIGEAGLCVPPGDVEGLEGALRRLATDYGRFREAALRRRDEMQSWWDWGRVADEILAVIDDVAAT